MKKALALLFAASALWACSPQEKPGETTSTEGTDTQQRATTTTTNEAAGAATTNAPSTNAPGTNATGGAAQ